MKTKQLRAIHRDLGYFYVGLIISFAFSGILMNHRSTWHPDKYTTEIKEIQVQLPENKSDISDGFVKNLAKDLQIEDKLKRHMLRRGTLRVMFNNTDVEIDVKTGKGEIISFIKTPFISQTMTLHKTNSNWWIYYSDIFGISLIIIAVTGILLINKGKFSFKNRGWKLALAGLVFPIVFLLCFL
ncbi:PepSY-associated TM helix domain-containing protein [Thalassobellus citreus]|uniref:PepSY-associated TM helix domain-containing protein n=1 Tax=Thalassobellus citreus TaxID=3367752 RepID=UPI0037A78801